MLVYAPASQKKHLYLNTRPSYHQISHRWSGVPIKNKKTVRDQVAAIRATATTARVAPRSCTTLNRSCVKRRAQSTVKAG